MVEFVIAKEYIRNEQIDWINKLKYITNFYSKKYVNIIKRDGDRITLYINLKRIINETNANLFYADDFQINPTISNVQKYWVRQLTGYGDTNNLKTMVFEDRAYCRMLAEYPIKSNFYLDVGKQICVFEDFILMDDNKIMLDLFHN